MEIQPVIFTFTIFRVHPIALWLNCQRWTIFFLEFLKKSHHKTLRINSRSLFIKMRFYETMSIFELQMIMNNIYENQVFRTLRTWFNSNNFSRLLLLFKLPFIVRLTNLLTFRIFLFSNLIIVNIFSQSKYFKFDLQETYPQPPGHVSFHSKLGLIGSAVLTFILHKQSDYQRTYIDEN